MNAFYIICCFITAVICFLGIISDKYADTLLQRIALAGIILAILGKINHFLNNDEVCPSTKMIIVSITLWSLCLFWKYGFISNAKKGIQNEK